MNYYETLYIVHSALEAGRLKDTILIVENFLKDSGGETISTDIWGKKKLGYLIEKEKYGTYILLQFKSDGKNNNNFNTEMEHNPSILAHMTVKIDEDQISKQTEDIDIQIAGKESKPLNVSDSKNQTDIASSNEKSAEESTEENVELEKSEEDSTVIEQSEDDMKVDSDENSDQKVEE